MNRKAAISTTPPASSEIPLDAESELKIAQEKLRWSEARRVESETLFEEAFHSSPASISIARLPHGELMEVNEAFTTWTGYSRHEVLGRTTRDLNIWVKEEDRARFLEKMQTQGRVRNEECLMRNRSGELETVLLSATVVQIDNRPHVLSVGITITAMKKSEAELRHALKKEQEIRRLKSNFIALVSHEFRTPLGIIYSAAEILEVYLDRLSETQRRDHLKDIKDAARQMTKLMEGVLTLERSESGKMQFQPKSLDVAALCIQLIQEIHTAFSNKCPITLHRPARIAPMMADEILLRHALSNLLSNAVKYSSPGAPIDLRVRVCGKQLEFEVVDQGIGIPKEDQAQLFEPFHRARNVGSESGSGLGLMIVRKCIQLHGGTIRVQSEVGEGTSIVLSLPLHQTNEPLDKVKTRAKSKRTLKSTS